MAAPWWWRYSGIHSRGLQMPPTISDPHDPEALYVALMAVMTNPHLRDQLRANAIR